MSEQQDVDAIRNDIEQTRADMGGKIDQIQERLDPANLTDRAQTTVEGFADQVLGHVRTKADELTSQLSEQVNAAVHGATSAKADQLMTQASDTARRVGGSLWEQISRNPAPVALAAVAIGLAASQVTKATEHGGDRGMQSTGMTTESSGQSQDAMEQEQGGGLAQQAQERTGEVVSKAQQQLQQVSQQMPGSMQGFLSDQPLAAGAIALGLGFAVGLMIPESDRERQAIAPLREQVTEKLEPVRQAGQDVMQEVKQSAGELTSQVTSATQETVQATKDAVQEGSQTAMSSIKDQSSEESRPQ